MLPVLLIACAMQNHSDNASRRTTPAASTPDYSHQDVLDGAEGILPGTRVVDREDDSDDPSQMVVLKVMRLPVSKVYVDNGPVSAFDGNQDYPDDSPAVVVAYRSDLDGRLEGWRATDRAMLFNDVQDVGIKTYTFPMARLVAESEVER